MTAFFNSTLFKRNLMRFWPIAAAAFLASLLIFVMPEASYSSSNLFSIGRNDVQFVYDQYGAPIASVKNIMTTLAIYCTVVVFPLSIITAIAVFGYLHNPKASGFVSSLPITRTGLYITNWLSGLALMLAPLLMVGALYGILLIGQPVPSWDFLRWIGALVASHFIFYSIAVFCTFLTGNPIMQAFIYGVSNFILYVFYNVGTALASMMVFGYSTVIYSPVSGYITWVTPTLAVTQMIVLMSPHNFLSYGNDANMPPVFVHWIIYLVFAALMIIFGWLLYRRRHIEVAGEVLVHRPVKSVFKYMMGLFMGILFAIMLMSFMIGGQTNYISAVTVWLTMSTIIFGALGCLFAEMLIQKRLQVWKTAYKGIIVYALSIAAVILFIRVDGTGFERRVPNQTDVASVSVAAAHMHMYGSVPTQSSSTTIFENYGDSWYLTGDYLQGRQRRGLPIYDDPVLNEIKLRTPVYFESPEAIAAAIRLHQTIADHGWYLLEGKNEYGDLLYNQTYTITYTMKNGSALTRVYALPINQTGDNNLVELLLDLYNQPESVDKRNRFVNIPDSSVLGAMLTPVFDNIWLVNTHYTNYTNRMYLGGKVFLEENLNVILEALRKDSENGTLGRVRHAYLLPADYILDDIATIGVIDLLLDFNAAGVPTAFVPDYFEDEDGNLTAGLVLSIIINENHVNTVQALKELQLLDN